MRARLPVWLVVASLVAGSLWAGWLGLRHLVGMASVIDRAETVLLDLRIAIRGPRKAPDSVVIVAIDDDTLAASNGNSIGRDTLARLLEQIQKEGARTIAIDMLLVGAGNTQTDNHLAKVLAATPTVIASAAQFSGETSHLSYVPAPDKVLVPQPEFQAAAAPAIVNIATDPGGTPRQIPLIFRTPSGLQPSFVLRSVGLFLGNTPSLAAQGLRFRDHTQPLDLGWHMSVNYYGPAKTITTISARQVLEGNVERDQLDGRMVLVGVTATGVGDRFGTPFDQVLPGVEILATGISNLLDETALVRSTEVRTADVVATISMTLAGMAALLVLPLASASILYILLVIGWLAITQFAFGYSYWLSAALPIAASLPPVLLLAIIRQVFERYAMGKLTRAQAALGQFQAPALARRIAEDPTFLQVPQAQEAAILFIDLSGYTGLSERIGPARTREILKAFHTLLVDVSAKQNGLVLDFMGDGAMIGFGIPDATAQDATYAVMTAFALQTAVTKWIAEEGLTREITHVRIGGHSGPVVLSRLGHENQQQIAATGDCVNVASRLQEVGKTADASIVLSTHLFTTAQRFADNLPLPPRHERVAIRGRQQLMDVVLWPTNGSIAHHPSARS